VLKIPSLLARIIRTIGQPGSRHVAERDGVRRMQIQATWFRPSFESRLVTIPRIQGYADECANWTQAPGVAKLAPRACLHGKSLIFCCICTILVLDRRVREYQ
jgi:hypothetical protein